MFKKGAKLLGIDNPDDFYPHSLRAMFITSLANNPGLSMKEILSSARHKSVTSSVAYMVSDGSSESAKFGALGMERSPKVARGGGNADSGEFLFLVVDFTNKAVLLNIS